MQWTSAISRAERASDALGEVIDSVWRALDEAPDFVAVFASRHHVNSAAEIPQTLARAFDHATIAGCVAYSVVGGGEEEEQQPSISVTAARLPDVRAELHIVSDVHDLRSLKVHEPGDIRALMILVDSFSADTDALLENLDELYPNATKFGGLASGGIYPGANVLFAADRALRQGAVIVAFEGDLLVDTIVAQGCRPIGEPIRVAEHRDNVITRFDNGKPQDVLAEIYAGLSADDQRHIPASLNIGLEMTAGTDTEPGEFLVRPIMGIDPNSGVLSVSERVRDNEIVQFHLRDATSSSDDLRRNIARYRASTPTTPSGAMLFSCIGRGERFFGEPNHDTAMFREAAGDVPIGGFFCAGEIGAVGERTFLHGFTSTFALFRPASDE